MFCTQADVAPCVDIPVGRAWTTAFLVSHPPSLRDASPVWIVDTAHFLKQFRTRGNEKIVVKIPLATQKEINPSRAFLVLLLFNAKLARLAVNVSLSYTLEHNWKSAEN